jgi:hypothetical protein
MEGLVMSAIDQQLVTELRNKLSVRMGQRDMLEAGRDKPGTEDQIRALDADVEVICKDLYAAERRLKESVT